MLLVLGAVMSVGHIWGVCVNSKTRNRETRNEKRETEKRETNKKIEIRNTFSKINIYMYIPIGFKS